MNLPQVYTGSAYFMVQLSHPYMTTGKTTALTIRAFVGKVMSLTKSEPNWKVTDSFQNPPAHLLRVKCCTLSVCGHGRSYSLRGFQLYGPGLHKMHQVSLSSILCLKFYKMSSLQRWSCLPACLFFLSSFLICILLCIFKR